MYSWNHNYIDGCRWGVSDWAPAFEKEMIKALESNEPFDTDWVGCTKEIESFRIVRDDNGVMIVSVSDSIDDVEDLVYDALYDVFEHEQDISEEDLDKICDVLYEDWNFATEIERSCVLYFKDASSTEENIQRLKDALDGQIDITHENLNCSYNFCKETVKEFFTEKYGWKVKEK